MQNRDFPSFSDAIEHIRTKKHDELHAHRMTTLSNMMDTLAEARSEQLKLPESERKSDAELLIAIKSTIPGRYLYIEDLTVDGISYTFKHDGLDNSVTPVV